MEQNIEIKMTKQEAIKYYANKIIEDSLAECSECNYCMDIDSYDDNGFIKQHQELILEEIKKDERVADVELDGHTFDMVFWTDYCPYCYEEHKLSKQDQSMILKNFIDQLITIKNNSIFLLNMNIQQIINEMILQNNFKTPLLEDEKEQANNMLKEIICNSKFFNKYLDRYKLIVNKQNIQELIDELLVKLQQLDLYKKDLIKVISKTDIDTMLKIFETNKQYPSEYIGMFRYKDLECNKYLAVDNSSGEMYIDEFDTEEECINYLLETDDEDDN